MSRSGRWRKKIDSGGSKLVPVGGQPGLRSVLVKRSLTELVTFLGSIGRESSTGVPECDRNCSGSTAAVR